MNTENQSSGIFTRLLMRIAVVKQHEVGAMLAAFAFVFCVFTSYSILRPVRDAMGITSGVSNLPILFWATFGVVLIIQPIYGWIASRYKRTQFLPWVWSFLIVNLVAFWLWFYVQADHTWIARAFFVWLTIYAVFGLSVFWSLCADVFNSEQAGRMFGFIAGGVSLGGWIGPGIAKTLAVPLGAPNLILISAVLLSASLIFMRQLINWQRAQGTDVAARAANEKPIGGNPFSGLYEVLFNRQLLSIAFFVLMLTWVNTFLYLEQQKLIAESITGADKQTAFLAGIDFWVQFVTMIIQMLAFSRLTSKLGIITVILILPVIVVFGFAWLAFNPILWVLIAVVVIRRIGEYALMRPCRELVFTTVPREAKYKAKNVIDTLVYRGGDATSGSVHSMLVSLFGLGTAGVAWVGALLAAIWGWSAWVIARRHQSLSTSGDHTAAKPAAH